MALDRGGCELWLGQSQPRLKESDVNAKPAGTGSEVPCSQASHNRAVTPRFVFDTQRDREQHPPITRSGPGRVLWRAQISGGDVHVIRADVVEFSTLQLRLALPSFRSSTVTNPLS